MKRCSTCNRTYTDPNLSFCIDDGTPLTPVEADDDATVVTPRNNPDDNWNARAYQPPGSYVPPGTEIKRRRMWPWVVGILGAFILGIATIAIVAAIVAPRLLRQAERSGAGNANQPAQNSNTNTAEPANANSATNEHVDVNTPPPTDHDRVLSQLTDLENEWTVANINADKKKLDRILADDYVAHIEGRLQSKADCIREIERNTTIQKWEFNDLKLTLTGERAMLVGKVKLIFQEEDREFDFADKFVWRGGRWQATGSEIAEIAESE